MNAIDDLRVSARLEETSQAAMKRFEEARELVDADYENFRRQLAEIKSRKDS